VPSESSPASSPRPTSSSAAAGDEVEVAGELTISGDEVTWVDSTLDTSNQQSLRVVPLTGAEPRTARLSPDATFFTPGVGTPRISADGLGAAPTSRSDFLALSPSGWFAPKLLLGPDGEITRIATRYRP
jgi:hypothetical protein